MSHPNETILNSAAFLKNTRMVGPGLRDAVWVQGCSIRCPGCANHAYLPHEKRVEMPVSRLIHHFEGAGNRIDGCSVLGGEPTEQAPAVTRLLAGVRKAGLSTVVFTGRLLEDLQKEERFAEMLANTDLLIDGPFVAALSDPSLFWRGSLNQRFHLLSDRWKPEELAADSPSGEIILTGNGVWSHGVGMGHRQNH